MGSNWYSLEKAGETKGDGQTIQLLFRLVHSFVTNQKNIVDPIVYNYNSVL
jgi:hypothetical protein